jgi:hypothetical protein
LPPDVRKFVRDNFGAMADRGEDFNATDVIMKPAPSRRFIRAGKSRGHWFLWYEQGGIAYWKGIVLFDGARIAMQSRTNWSDDLCAETDRLLDGGTLRR